MGAKVGAKGEGHTVPAKQNSSRSNTSLRRNLHNRLSSEQRATGAAERTVSGDMDADLITEIYNLLLRQRRVILDLVDGWHDRCLRQQFLEVLDAIV